MVNETNQTIKNFVKSDNSSLGNDNPIFLENDKSDTYLIRPKQQQKADLTNYILDVVREKQPISVWDLEKITGKPHSTIFECLKNMEFIGLVYSRMIVNEKNRKIRLFSTTKNFRQKRSGESHPNTKIKKENGEDEQI